MLSPQKPIEGDQKIKVDWTLEGILSSNQNAKPIPHWQHKEALQSIVDNVESGGILQPGCSGSVGVS
jgi:hypothetical protein